jgi:hypothetical protein
MEDYAAILTEMQKELENFSSKSRSLNAYDYEKEFRKITDKYDQKLFQVSVGKVPKSKNKKKSIETSFGKINVKKKGHPMSQTPMSFKISPILQESICRLGSKLTFREASEELTSLLRISVNAKQVERVCHCYGEQIDLIDWKQAYSSGVQLNLPFRVNSPVYCMADGSMLLTREDKWKEIKLGRVFSESSHIDRISKNRGGITKSIYCAHFGRSSEFWERFVNEIPINRKLVFICDGAKWLWNNIEASYPESIQILDFYHCKEHIFDFGKSFFGKKEKELEEFVDQVMEYLSTKKVKEALGKIKEMPTKNKTTQIHQEKLLKYLTNNEKRIDYGSFIEKGYLIGSGPIEAAHRDVLQKRLKLSGQRWTIKGAQQIANLRVCEKSGKWNRVISLITETKSAA